MLDRMQERSRCFGVLNLVLKGMIPKLRLGDRRVGGQHSLSIKGLIQSGP